jgi:hypothetical protein
MHWSILDFSYAMSLGLLPLTSIIDPRLLGIQNAISSAFMFDIEEFINAYVKTTKAVRERLEELKEGGRE